MIVRRPLLRLAYAEVLEGLNAHYAVAFLRRAIAWFGERGVRVEAVKSDNGVLLPSRTPTPTRSTNSACATSASDPVRPRTNGKAERFIQTLLNEWAYHQIYGSSEERTRALPPFLERYNYRRPHGSLGNKRRPTRLNNLARNYI